MQTAKKKRNVAIELWRFLIAFAIIGFHTGWIIAMSCDGSLGYWMERSNWFFGSSEVLLIFTVTAGYFMVSHFTNRKNDQLYMSRSASSRAWEYTWSRIKALLPVLILGYVLGIVISTAFFYPDYTTHPPGTPADRASPAERLPRLPGCCGILLSAASWEAPPGW